MTDKDVSKMDATKFMVQATTYVIYACIAIVVMAVTAKFIIWLF